MLIVYGGWHYEGDSSERIWRAGGAEAGGGCQAAGRGGAGAGADARGGGESGGYLYPFGRLCGETGVAVYAGGGWRRVGGIGGGRREAFQGGRPRVYGREFDRDVRGICAVRDGTGASVAGAGEFQAGRGDECAVCDRVSRIVPTGEGGGGGNVVGARRDGRRGNCRGAIGAGGGFDSDCDRRNSGGTEARGGAGSASCAGPARAGLFEAAHGPDRRARGGCDPGNGGARESRQGFDRAGTRRAGGGDWEPRSGGDQPARCDEPGRGEPGRDAGECVGEGNGGNSRGARGGTGEREPAAGGGTGVSAG